MTRPKRPPEGPCHYCGAEADNRDHIVPVSLGGPEHLDNLVWSCEPCNQAKAAEKPTCECAQCRAAVAMWWPLDPKHLYQRVVVPGFEWLVTA